MVAAFHGHAECVEILAGKEARMRDERCMTALMFAAANGHAECVRILALLE